MLSDSAIQNQELLIRELNAGTRSLPLAVLYQPIWVAFDVN
jgi:hypothetical protein